MCEIFLKHGKVVRSTVTAKLGKSHMKTARFFALLLGTTAALATARATTVIPPSFDELVAQAQVIFEGTVTDVQSQWVGEGGQRHIVSYVTMKVEDPIKGEPGATYTLRMLGGTVGDQTMRVTDSPVFKVGDRDIVFVENNGSQFVPLVGIMHGRFRVTANDGRQVVLTNNGAAVSDLAHLGKDDAILSSHAHSEHSDASASMDAAAFKSAIRAKLEQKQK
jgi:hypothetical protein